ncbi:MAG: IclR family transcriptional regulator [Myxococcota bacterium]
MARTSSKPRSEYAIQTVANALRMLEVFHSVSEMGVSDLARRLKLHKNNAFRLLATLELAGYIQQSPETENYRLGPRCLELGHAFARSQKLMSLARPILEGLSAELCETTHLGILVDDQVVHLDGVLPNQLVLTGSRVGERLPSHCTALGKVLLGGDPGESAAASIASGGATRAAAGVVPGSARRVAGGADPSHDRQLISYTKTTIVDPTKLIEELRNVQMQGYAVDVEEYAAGLCCVAAPVRDATTRVVAAISISGPSLRLPEDALHGEAVRAVVAAASQLSRELGARL